MARLHSSLRSFASSDRSRAGIFCDFDGTLSDIVSEPSLAEPVRGATEVLEALARSYRVVAVVSGRTVEELSRMLPAPNVRLVGVHGLEELIGDRVVISPGAGQYLESIERAGRLLDESLANHEGIMIERKKLSIAVHVRNAPDPIAAFERVATVAAQIARAESLDSIFGRRVVELRPRAGGDKGDVVRRIGSELGLKAVFAIGDDVSDLAMFANARSFEISACVGISSDESPPELAGSVDATVSNPREAVELLRSMI
ncbi:MAG: trehalose-phosphatase [Actinomycetota bacterium]